VFPPVAVEKEVRAVRDRRGRFIAILVALWGIVAIDALISYGTHQSRQDHVQAVRRGNEIAHPRPQGRADLGGGVRVLRGAVEFADTKRLVLEVADGEPKRYVFAMANATIRVGGKEGGVGDLRRNDVVSVLYAEAYGERMAKMVLVTDTERR
jgi:hypothetical protein